jgi:hypothetical protein
MRIEREQMKPLVWVGNCNYGTKIASIIPSAGLELWASRLGTGQILSGIARQFVERRNGQWPRQACDSPESNLCPQLRQVRLLILLTIANTYLDVVVPPHPFHLSICHRPYPRHLLTCSIDQQTPFLLSLLQSLRPQRVGPPAISAFDCSPIAALERATNPLRRFLDVAISVALFSGPSSRVLQTIATAPIY